MSLLLITIVFGLIGMIVSMVLQGKFKRYSQIPLMSRLSGKEIAEKMLRANGIYDVQITSIEGQLSDHYNPENKTVNLSQAVYEGRSIAAAAVAAHECGHAVQHATAYSMLTLRSKLVPIVSFSTNVLHWVFMLGFMGIAFGMFNNYYVLLGIIALQATVTMFSLVTLPVEMDASARALAFIENNRIAQSEEEYRGAKDALTWAGLTYFVAAIASIAQLLYFMMRLNSRRD